MIWDCLIAWVILVFTTAGWSAGALRCWALPVAMAISTLVSQHIYVDLSSVLVELLHLEPTLAVFVSYVFTWFWIMQYCENFLLHMVPAAERNPGLASKIGGGFLGFLKGAGAFVLAALVAGSQIAIPDPPHLSQANSWILRAARDSFLLPRIHLVACQLNQPIGKYVLSSAPPRIQANILTAADPFESYKKTQERRGFEFMEGWKRLQHDLGYRKDF